MRRSSWKNSHIRDAVLEEACAHFKMSRRELIDDSRFHHIIVARHTVCLLAREMAEASYNEIGWMMSRDHSSVISACRKMAERVERDAEIAAHVDAVRRRVAERMGAAE
jgi:chromosomal replication initiation ATPase DnaA